MGLGGLGGPARRAPPTSLKEPARLRHQPGACALIHTALPDFACAPKATTAGREARRAILLRTARWPPSATTRPWRTLILEISR